MRLSQILKNTGPLSSGRTPAISFEFFPPRERSLLPDTITLIRELAAFCPDFMTVTYGAGGGSRDLTQALLRFILTELRLPAVSHLTCVGHSSEEIRAIVAEMKDFGVENILSLRGDPPKGETTFTPHPEGFSCARDLTRFLGTLGEIECAVAGYPEPHKESLSPEADINYLKEKVESGAVCIITQLFFDNSHYFRFVDHCHAHGITVPIIPGIMPVANVGQVKRFTGMCGATIPQEMLTILDELDGDTQAVTQFGIEYATAQCRDLLQGGAPGIHLYTLNRSKQVQEIVSQLRGGMVATQNITAESGASL